MAFREDNKAQTERLRSALSGITDTQWSREIGGGWTVGTMVCHLGFWDQMTLTRLSRWKATGKLAAVPDADNIEVINESVRRISSSIGRSEGARQAVQIASEIDEYVAALSPADLRALEDSGRDRWFKRSLHREHHLPRIEGGLK